MTVIATLDTTASGGVRAYQEVQSDIQNPTANSNYGGPAGGGTTATPWTFWLTDTPCNNNSRQQISGDHKAHNTRGLCSNGLQTGDNSTCGLLHNIPCPGAPDLMYTEAPPCAGSPPDCTTAQPLYDYATDVDPTRDPNNDKGLQFRAGPACNSCQSTWDTSLSVLNDSFDPQYFQKVHKWVSPPIPSGYGPIVFNGTGELDLWTKTVNNAVQSGKICAYLFYRHQVLGLTVDTPVINLDLSNLTYFTYSQNPWPTTWTELHIPLHFNLSVGNALSLVQNQQLGLAISVDGGGTGAGALEALYDAPSFDSRLQLQVNPGISLPF